jgi:hypothetical protein
MCHLCCSCCRVVPPIPWTLHHCHFPAVLILDILSPAMSNLFERRVTSISQKFQIVSYVRQLASSFLS